MTLTASGAWARTWSSIAASTASFAPALGGIDRVGIGHRAPGRAIPGPRSRARHGRPPRPGRWRRPGRSPPRRAGRRRRDRPARRRPRESRSRGGSRSAASLSRPSSQVSCSSRRASRNSSPSSRASRPSPASRRSRAGSSPAAAATGEFMAVSVMAVPRRFSRGKSDRDRYGPATAPRPAAAGDARLSGAGRC